MAVSTATSSMLDILKKLGDATPPPIHLSRLIESPLQDLCSFAVERDRRAVLPRMFELLAEQSVNLRFITEQPGEMGACRIQFSFDAEARERATEVFEKLEIAKAMKEFKRHEAVVILSVYPFNGQPNVAERIFTVCRQAGIQIRGVNSATSVFSCIVSGSELEALLSCLRKVFVWH
jgi:aspartokinase